MNPMKGKMWTTEEWKLNILDQIVGHDIVFYNVVRDEKCFGKPIVEAIPHRNFLVQIKSFA